MTRLEIVHDVVHCKTVGFGVPLKSMIMAGECVLRVKAITADQTFVIP